MHPPIFSLNNLFFPLPLQVLDFFSEGTAARITRNGAAFNPGISFLVDTCDVIVVTGSQPLATYQRIHPAPQILVIHGSKGCNWTYNYARHANLYDGIVGVSQGSLDVIESLPLDRARGVVIPSGLNALSLVSKLSREELLTEYGILPKMLREYRDETLQVLLFLGRISSEKKPQFFIDVVEKLPSNWVGVMAGPAYFEESLNLRKSVRVQMVGRQRSADALSIADAVLLASPSEGGPIVLLEAWAVRVPFFMRRTGLAAAYPDSVFIIDETETAENVANRLPSALASPLVREILDNGYRTFMSTFTIQKTSSQWRELLVDVVASACKCARCSMRPIVFVRSDDATITVDGRARILGFKHTAQTAPPPVFFFLLIGEAQHFLLEQKCKDAWTSKNISLTVILRFSLESVSHISTKDSLGTFAHANLIAQTHDGAVFETPVTPFNLAELARNGILRLDILPPFRMIELNVAITLLFPGVLLRIAEIIVES